MVSTIPATIATTELLFNRWTEPEPNRNRTSFSRQQAYKRGHWAIPLNRNTPPTEDHKLSPGGHRELIIYLSLGVTKFATVQGRLLQSAIVQGA